MADDIRSGGTSAKTSVFSAVNCRLRASPPAASSRKIAATGQAGLSSASAPMPIAATQPLAISAVRKPVRRSSGRTIGFIAKAPSAVAKETKPLSVALMPKPICSMTGIRKGTAPAPVRKMLPARAGSRKLGMRNSERSTAGRSRRRMWRTASTPAASPSTSAAAEIHPGTTCRPTVSIPNITSASAAPVSARPARSGGPGRVGATCGIFHATSTKPITPIGTLIQNTARQENRSVSTPPSGGPVTGPSSAGMVSQAMAESMSFFATPRSSSNRPTGTIMAPPSPCSTRKATSSPSPCARPHSSDEQTKTTIASMKTRFAPKRSAIQAEKGMKTVSATR